MSVGAARTRLPVVRSVLLERTAALTVTPSVAGVLKSPLKARARVAEMSPPLTLDTEETKRFGMAVTSVKLNAETPLVKVAPR